MTSEHLTIGKPTPAMRAGLAWQKKKVAMAAPVRLREDFDGLRFRALAKRTGGVGQLRRHLAVAEI